MTSTRMRSPIRCDCEFPRWCQGHWIKIPDSKPTNETALAALAKPQSYRKREKYKAPSITEQEVFTARDKPPPKNLPFFETLSKPVKNVHGKWKPPPEPSYEHLTSKKLTAATQAFVVQYSKPLERHCVKKYKDRPEAQPFKGFAPPK